MAFSSVLEEGCKGNLCYIFLSVRISRRLPSCLHCGAATPVPGAECTVAVKVKELGDRFSHHLCIAGWVSHCNLGPFWRVDLNQTFSTHSRVNKLESQSFESFILFYGESLRDKGARGGQ